MNPERWQRVQILVEDALAQPESLRHAFVGASCGEDHELRDEVISLLDACARSPESPEPPMAWFGLLARSEPPRFERDERVADRYRIRRLVGRGGMGDVYEVWDEDLSITVALKTLRLAGGTETAHSRLRLEGILARSIWHPNVCRLYDLGRHGEGDDAAWFLTMELLHGVTLAEVLQTKGRLPLDRARYLGIQMAGGLEAAHRAGVVHRDFKPGNAIIVNRDGDEQAVVTDFGIARAASRAESPRRGRSDPQSGSGPLIGTPIYMAPEQVRGEEAGPAADIYALGIVLYEMVTGTVPFSGDSALEAATRRLQEDAPSPRRIVPDLDESWGAVILRCLARDPIERFRRAEEVARALMNLSRVEIAESPGVSSRAVPPSLPAERDPFVGREDESEDLRRAFAGKARLVTLVGPGGIGKTLLAMRYEWQSVGAWPGGVWFCNLAETWSLDGIASAIADSLGIQLGPGDPVGLLGHAIAGRGRCLVILDNVEQVVDLAAATVRKWLARAGEARFLVTSREKLNLGELEKVLAVGPLPIEAGLELFASRAQRLRPAIAVIGPEEESVREIVRILDGIPLAIELAAAWMRVMTATEIAAHMRRRFSLLTGGASARHETMIIAIDSSWELLHPWEQSAWSQCAVFEGGFTLQAAAQVIDLSAWPEAPQVVDVVQSLVDKSLLRTWVPAARPGEPMPEARFGMFVILHEYARMKLRLSHGHDGRREDGAGAESAASIERVVEERHGKWFARYGATEAMWTLTEHGAPGVRPRVDRELDNLLAACRRAIVRRDAATAVTAYRAAWTVLNLRGPFNAAVDLGRDLLKELSLARDQEAQAAKALGQAEWYAGMMEDARAHSETALAIARQVLDRKTEALVLLDLGGMKASQGRMEEAGADLERALEIARATSDQPTACTALNTLSIVRRGQGRMEEAATCSEEALEIARRIGNARMEGTILSNLGLILQDQGRTGEARAHYEAALAIHRKVGNRRFEGNTRGNLGGLDYDHGRLDEARAHLEAALAIHRETGARSSEGVALVNLGFLCCSQKRTEEALAHLEAALTIEREVDNRRMEGIIISALGTLHQERGEMEQARADYESAVEIHRAMNDRRSEGDTLSHMASLLHRLGSISAARETLAKGESLLREVDAQVELGQLLCTRAEIEHGEGEIAQALATFREAEDLARRLGSGPDSELIRRIDELRGAIGRVRTPRPDRGERPARRNWPSDAGHGRRRSHPGPDPPN